MTPAAHGRQGREWRVPCAMDQVRVWDEMVGEAWVRHAEFLERHSAPFAEATLRALGPVDGLRILDVGCGTGGSSRALARAGAAQVLGVDLSNTMIAAARTQVHGDDGGDVRFEAADVADVGAHGDFDAVFSQFGVMFFDDAVDGFRALRELTTPTGRLAFCAWTDPFSNPWMMVPVLASFDVLGPPDLPGAVEPGPFSLGAEDHVREVLGAAGWRGVDVHQLELTSPFDDGGAEATARVVLETNPVLALGLESVPSAADALRGAVAAALAPHEVNGQVRLAASALVVMATAA